MQFNLPTSKEQMYTILNDLFYYYRIRREGFEEVNLLDLNLTRLEVNFPSDSDIESEATLLLSSKHEREIKDYENKRKIEIEQIKEKISLCEQNAISEIALVNANYETSIEKIEKQAIKSGLLNSSIVVDKTAQLEDSKNQKIAQIEIDKNEKTSSLSAKKQALELEIENSNQYFSSIHQKEIQEKIVELKEKRETLRINTFKYNNGLDEKEQRYANTIKESKCSLKLRFLDISSGEFTKDQLIDMGYYEDVIRCICGYYDILDPVTAYHDIAGERKLAIYLEDYYQDIVFTYKLIAGI